MPKIIENLREQLLLEAKKQIAETGYGKTTVRSIARACGVGVGTVYNYFRSKDHLVASFLLAEWQTRLDAMKAAAADEPAEALRRIHGELASFLGENRALFADAKAAEVFALSSSRYHAMLREQLASVLLPVCEQAKTADRSFLARFVAEALLTWTTADVPFSSLWEIFSAFFDGRGNKTQTEE